MMRGWVILLVVLMGGDAFAVSQNSSFARQYMGCDKGDTVMKSHSCTAANSEEFCARLEKFPEEIQNKIGLELHCNFLAGEFNGDKARDEELNSAIESLGCYGNDTQSMRLLRRYADKPAETKALLFFSDEYNAAEGKCR